MAILNVHAHEPAKKDAKVRPANGKSASPEPEWTNLLWHQLATRVQTKLSVSAPGDPSEREADRVADQVIRMPAPGLQRSCACAAGSTICPQCEEDRKEERPVIQRTAGPDGDTAATSVSDEFLASLGSGRGLDQETRSFMEPRFGRSFASVRVHADSAAAESAQAIGARAYTVGPHLVFGKEQYAPGSGQGRRLLAHELTHVMQQGAMGDVRTHRPSSAYADNSVHHFSPTTMVQRDSFRRDPIHDPIVAQFRQEYGLPPSGIDPQTGERGPSDSEITHSREYERWLRKGNVPAPSSPPSLSTVPPPLDASQCGTVQPGMPAAQADPIISCITHARYMGFLAQSISNMAQVSSPYSPALSQLYLSAMQRAASAGMANPPRVGAPRDFSISNVSVTVSGDTVQVPSFTLRLQQLRTPTSGALENGAFSPALGGVALTEDSDQAVVSNQPDIERTVYHEGIHFLSAVVTDANRRARGTPGTSVIHPELDTQLTSSYQTRFLSAVAPIWTLALAQVSASPGSLLGPSPTTTQLGNAQWMRVENEIISRVEEAVYLALRSGRGFTTSDLQALPQPWLATPAYWDPLRHFVSTTFAQFLAGQQNAINSGVLPLIQEIQARYLYLRPAA